MEQANIKLFVLTIILVVISSAAHAIECHHKKGEGYWQWRSIDGVKCWYPGKKKVGKSQLHWPKAKAYAPPAKAEAPAFDLKDGPPGKVQPRPLRVTPHIITTRIVPAGVPGTLAVPVPMPEPVPESEPEAVEGIVDPNLLPALQAHAQELRDRAVPKIVQTVPVTKWPEPRQAPPAQPIHPVQQQNPVEQPQPVFPSWMILALISMMFLTLETQRRLQ